MDKFLADSFYAVLEISSTLAFEDTAKLIGDKLNLRFELDTSGRFEEFPAFTTLCMGISFAFIGNPEGSMDKTNFELEVASDFSSKGNVADISGYLIRILNKIPNITCRNMK
jgi:hypothetical protein